MNLLLSTIGKRNYLANYFREIMPEGSRIIGTGNNKNTIGFLSCDISYLIPSFSEVDYASAIIQLCKAENINAIFTFSDLELPVLSKIKEQLEKMNIVCFFPDENTVSRYLNKHETYLFLTQNDFKTPETYISLEEAIENIGFPMVIKPREGYASTGFLIVNDKNEATHHWNKIQNPIGQKFIDGQLINVEACSDSKGILLSLSSWIKHKSISGETLVAETKINYNAIGLVERLLKISPIPGPIDVDLIVFEDEIYILEVNTRFGGGYPVSHLAGANFPKKLLQSIDGIIPPNLISIEENITMMKELVPVNFSTKIRNWR
jgi:carbamoyl-phosphate synthase large subunit